MKFQVKLYLAKMNGEYYIVVQEKPKKFPRPYTLKEIIYDLGIWGEMKGASGDGIPGAHSIWQGLEVLCVLWLIKITLYKCGSS